jgi:ABC-type multidrug transport system ATPase subunit
LTGLIAPTSGDALIHNHSIVKEQDSIRKMMGICPQVTVTNTLHLPKKHDILWEELTAEEHLELFAEFKGVPAKFLRDMVNEKLKEVELFHVFLRTCKKFTTLGEESSFENFFWWNEEKTFRCHGIHR